MIISDLYSLNPVSGNVSLIGSLLLGASTSMAFAPDGTLYGWVVDADGHGNHVGLATIDIETGAATDVNPLIAGDPSQVQTLAFDASGNLFGARHSLYEIDVQTGALFNGQYISDFVDVRGMEFLPVPIPSAFLMLISGFAVLGFLFQETRSG